MDQPGRKERRDEAAPVAGARPTPYSLHPGQRLLVAIARGKHPFPSRTRQLRPAAPRVLPLIRGGRVGRRQRIFARSAPVRGAGLAAFRILRNRRTLSRNQAAPPLPHPRTPYSGSIGWPGRGSNDGRRSSRGRFGGGSGSDPGGVAMDPRRGCEAVRPPPRGPAASAVTARLLVRSTAGRTLFPSMGAGKVPERRDCQDAAVRRRGR
jgi:hypothetical protein